MSNEKANGNFPLYTNTGYADLSAEPEVVEARTTVKVAGISWSPRRQAKIDLLTETLASKASLNAAIDYMNAIAPLYPDIDLRSFCLNPGEPSDFVVLCGHVSSTDGFKYDYRREDVLTPSEPLTKDAE